MPRLSSTDTSFPPEAWGPALRLARLARRPLERFFQIQAASGLVLIACAMIALGIASSRFGASYSHFWHTPVAVEVAGHRFERSLEWIVNDGLMAIFFFVVGMEIRREVHQGELSDLRRAALPAAAALGGMLFPAAIYLLVAYSRAHEGWFALVRPGWGVPMATDIAFAVGVLTLLGKRVPPALRVLLLALAVIDDLGAIIVIALFYSKGIHLAGLGVAAGGLALLLLLRFAGVRAKLAYVAPALVIWGGTYAAGIHPTIAGVVVGLLTPVRAWLGTDGAREGLEADVRALSRSRAGGEADLSAQELASVLRHVDAVRREATSPAEALIETLHPWVAFVIMPLFALANAGVALGGAPVVAAGELALVATAAGLALGKPLGICVACAISIRLGIAKLPRGLGWRHVLVLGLVAGIGFTMALFVAQLAFNEAAMLGAVKLGVLAASGGAAIVALAVGRLALPAPSPVESSAAAETADEAEDSTEA